MEKYELYHWGIKGMKWGVRRYQNKDGTRTPAGLKRYATKVKEGIAKRKAEKAAEKQRKKPLSKLTDEELQTKINRLQKEKQALDLERSVSSLDAKPISAGKSFVKTAMQKVVTPSLVDAGKDILTKYLKDRIGNKLGLNGKEIDDALSGLKQEVAELNLRKQKKEAEDYLSGKKDDADDLAKAAKEWGYMKTIAEGKLKVRDLKNKTSEDKSKSTSKDDSHIDKLLNTKVDDLSDADISDMDEWLESLGSI